MKYIGHGSKKKNDSKINIWVMTMILVKQGTLKIGTAELR